MWGTALGLAMMATGLVLVILGSGSLDAATKRREAVIQSSLTLSSRPGEAFARFTGSSLYAGAIDDPALLSFFLWNVTNGAEVLAGTAAPRVQQMGPYTYEKRSTKLDVVFHNTLSATNEEGTGESVETASAGFQYVSYALNSTLVFSPERSNGTEDDWVVTLNATYARRLAQYRAAGRSERLILADFAHRHLAAYHRELRQTFVAETKQRALGFYLPNAVAAITRESVGPAIARQRRRVDSAAIPGNLVQMAAVARTELIPQVLGDVYKDVSDLFLPGILQSQLDAAKTHALPRVLDNLVTRLETEAVPVLLAQQLRRQRTRLVPRTLQSLIRRLPQVAFPYVLQEVYDRACLEAVPRVLRSIKLEIIARDIADNRVQADVAQNNVIETWRRRFGATTTAVNFDTWIDDAPTGKPRTGFELKPGTTGLELSKEVATLLLGSKSSNRRFSVVDYDSATQATYPLDEPTTTPVGFAIWKQVLALNETAMQYVLDGVNSDVALTSDFLTRPQLLAVRDYLLKWAQSDVVLRDRERFWRQRYAKRTTETDFTEPDVDLDVEALGVQTGFTLQPAGPTTSGVTAAIAQQVWNASDRLAFTHAQGFTNWYQAAVLGNSTATQTLLGGIPGLTSAHLTEIATWLRGLLGDGFVRRRALRHWADGTCVTVLRLPRSPCVLYDLEPHIPGLQTGLEMNPTASTAIVVPAALREVLWDATQAASFLLPVHAANTTAGFGWWLQAARTDNQTMITTALGPTYPSFTAAAAAGILTWLRGWATHPLNVLHLENWWRTSTCWPREILNATTTVSTITASQPKCSAAYAETEQSAVIIAAAAPSSPFSTVERVVQVASVECAYDASAKTYTTNTSTYQLGVREFACDQLPTDVADDQEPSDFLTGFELAPTVLAAVAPIRRPSLAVVRVLWDPTNVEVSFLTTTGYRRWLVEVATGTVAQQSMVAAINAALPTACAQILGAGDHSAIFNATLYGTDASCAAVTTDQVTVLAGWIQAQRTLPWVRAAILDQWRRGSVLNVGEVLDLEPYRPGLQAGLELASGCRCELTTASGTAYLVPRAALSLWDRTVNNASFVGAPGYGLWVALQNATAANDTTAIADWQATIATASGLAQWSPWLEFIGQWLAWWATNEHLMRDVLGHWLHAACPTSPPIRSTVADPPVTTTTVGSCPAADQRYVVTLNDTVNDLVAQASRPAFADFFAVDVVETTARIRPTKVLEVTETWIDKCEPAGGNQFTQTTKTRTTVKELGACNLLEVLAAETESAWLWAPREVTFELNRTTEGTANISIDAALAMWASTTPTASDWAFTNQSTFLAKWQPAMHAIEAQVALEDKLNAAIPRTPTTELGEVLAYMAQWQASSVSSRRVGTAWLSSTSPYLDLDPTIEGPQTGFELFPTLVWRKIAGNAASGLPTVDQADYLWNAHKAYSFLNTQQDSIAGLPSGFRAWKEIYDGTDYSSERLVSAFPPVAQTTRSGSTRHALNPTEQEALMDLIGNATLLTRTQQRGIAAWAMAWAENPVLRDYFLRLWATGRTPRGQAGAVFDFSRATQERLGLELLAQDGDAFSVNDMITLKAVPMTTLRSLWDVKVTGSVVQPTSQVLWCVVDVPGLGRCPHVLHELGWLNDSYVETIKRLTGTDEELTRNSDVSSLAFKFFLEHFDLVQTQVLSIARWSRELPQRSVFFQTLQLRTWLDPAYPWSAVDPLRLGFDLSRVFPTTEPGIVPRDAGIDDLVPNPVNWSDASCNVSLDLVSLAWNASRPSSFLHPDGLGRWLDLAESPLPRNTTHLTRELEASDTSMNSTMAQIGPDAVHCTLDALAYWLSSWQQHPLTRQLVESLWTSPGNGSESPIGQFARPSTGVRAFALAAAMPLVFPSDSTLVQLNQLARVVLDANNSMALTNTSMGFPLWHATLEASCGSSDLETLQCARRDDDDAAARRQFSRSAVGTLSQRIWQGLHDLQIPEQPQPTTVQDIQGLVQDRIVPWLIHLLDSNVLREFIVDHIHETSSADWTFEQLTLAQFVNATITRINFTLPSGIDVDTADDHIGVESQRITRRVQVFDPTTNDTVRRNTTATPGFGEFSAFCEWNAFDEVYAYDTTHTCRLGQTYQLSFATAEAILQAFEDNTTYAIPNSSVVVPRAALLLDAFLAQPFSTPEQCQWTVASLAEPWELSSTEQVNACVVVSGKIYIDLPMLSRLELSPVTNADFVRDFQAYLRYAATKLVYEPSVLRLPTRELTRADLQSPPPLPPSTTRAYPLGGLLANQSVAQALAAEHGTTSLWQLEPSLRSPRFTMLVPATASDAELLYKKDRPVGGLVAIDNATTIGILGTPAQLSAFYATDSSQFTTGIFTARRYATTADAFPPPKLLFFWDYPRRLVQLAYSKNVTRFGVPLMRFVVRNWQEPTSFPTGIASIFAGTAPESAINVSVLIGGLPLVLSPAPAPSTSSSPMTSEASREAVVDVDPVTGMAFHRRLTWTLSTHLEANAAADIWHPAVATTWLPVVWIRDQRSVSTTTAAAFRSAVVQSGPFATEKLALWGVVGGALYLVAGAALSYVYHRRAQVVRLRRMQSVMPAEGLASVDDDRGLGLKKAPLEQHDPTDHGVHSHSATEPAALVGEYLHSTSDVVAVSTGLASSTTTATPRGRKRTTPRIQTIEEHHDEGHEVQQL